jgi:hypothetical protein
MLRYIVKAVLLHTDGEWDDHAEELCLDYASAEMRATELMANMEELSILDWLIAIYDNGEPVAQWNMDDAQPLYDHRVATVALGPSGRMDAHGNDVHEGQMMIGFRDNLPTRERKLT